MRVRTAILLLGLCVILAFPAQAARFSGEYLLHVCGSDEQGREIVAGGHAACQSYIAGVLDYHNLIHSMGTSPSVDFCVPKDVTLNVLQKQVFAYLAKNQKEHKDFIAAPGVALALFDKYPCKK